MMKRDQLLLTGSLVQFALLIPLGQWARKHPQPPVEIAISRLVQHKQRSLVRSFVLVLNTLTGSAVFLNILAVPVAALLWKMRLRLEALMTVASCWTSALARTAIKQAVDRPRPKPPFVHVSKPSRAKSFPSGHVASAMTLWGWLFTLGLLSKKEEQPGRRALLTVPAVCVMLTGPARIYLGDHWATDILGGYLFGGGWLALSLRFYLRWREQWALPGVGRWGKSGLAPSHAPGTPDRVPSLGTSQIHIVLKENDCF